MVCYGPTFWIELRARLMVLIGSRIGEAWQRGGETETGPDRLSLGNNLFSEINPRAKREVEYRHYRSLDMWSSHGSSSSMSFITTKQLLRVVHRPLTGSVRAHLAFHLSCHFLRPVSHLAFHSRPIHSAQVLMGHGMDKTSQISEISFIRDADVMYIDAIPGVNPYAYTSGRWLRQDKLECNSRYIKFDFDALCQRVIELDSGANSIASCSKLEGGFNRVFIFTLDTGKRIVARIPFPFAGPTRLTTASEVATMRYCKSTFRWSYAAAESIASFLVQAKTSVPLPTILDWSDDATNNIIGSEYIIMEHAPGVPLREKWHEMAGDERVRCIDVINRRMKEIVDLEFPAFGSIYFTDAPFDSSSKLSLDEDFCIGPHCNPRYWDCHVSERRYYHYTKPNHGPCKFPKIRILRRMYSSSSNT